MTTRTLELNLRAKADTKDIERLAKETLELSAALRRASATFDDANSDARKLAQAYQALSQQEQAQITGAGRMAAAVEQTANARERAAAAATEAAAAEARVMATQQQAEGAMLRTAAAQEQLSNAQGQAATSVTKAATAEEKLAQERQKTLAATSKSEKAELDVAKAREQLRAATARAEAAEQRLGQTRKTSGETANSLKLAFQGFIAGGVVLAAGRQLLAFGQDSIAAASDAEESAAKFQQVFKDLSGGVSAELETMADANRRSIYDLTSYASTLQDTFVPLGFARDQAADLSTTITQLALDIAAFSNKSDSDVLMNLTSAIVGNHEAVRSYGIVLTETVLKQELARLGALEYTGAALEVAKAQARVNIIMRSSADAQGAAVREAGSYANTLKAWDAAMTELKVSLGEGLLPMMTELVNIATAAAEILSGQSADAIRQASTDALASAKTQAEVSRLIAETQKNVTEAYRTRNPNAEALGDTLGAQVVRYAEVSSSADEFTRSLSEQGVGLKFLADASRQLGLDNSVLTLTYEEIARAIYEAATAAQEYDAILRGASQADQGMINSAEAATANARAVREQIEGFDLLAESGASFVDTASAGQEHYSMVLMSTRDALVAAREAQLAWNAAFGESFNNAPIDPLIEAQQNLRDATGEWGTATIDNSSQIGDIQRQLGADLTRDQEAQLRKQLQDLDEFSSEYMGIIRQLEGDLSDTQRLDLLDQLTSLEGQQGQTVSTYSGDIEAAEEARQAIIEANQAIQDSYYERAYNSIAARLIEEGNFEQMASIAVGLGLMTQEEADLRLGYAETTAALDALTASTAFYGLTAEQQVGAVKSLAAGVYDTAAAALQAQENLKKAQEFYSTAPDSTAISDYYTGLAAGLPGAVDEGITTVVSVAIDPTTQREFTGFRDELEDFDSEIYKTMVEADTLDAERDFEKMTGYLEDLTRSTWVIKVRYETDGSAPATGGGGGGSTGGGGGGGPELNGYPAFSTSSGPYVDLTVNNYAGGDVGRTVREGVLAAFRSLG